MRLRSVAVVVIALAIAAALAMGAPAWAAPGSSCAAGDLTCRTTARRTAQAGDEAAPGTAARPLHNNEGVSVAGIALIVVAGAGAVWLLRARVRRRMVGI